MTKRHAPDSDAPPPNHRFDERYERNLLHEIIRAFQTYDYNRMDEGLELLRENPFPDYFRHLLANSMVWQSSALAINPQCVVSAPQRPSFDFTFWQTLTSAT